MKPKLNRKVAGIDLCQTPDYALAPILPYLDPKWVIWEPCAGEGNLTRAFLEQRFQIVEGDILTGQDFFEYEPNSWDCLVTNPPYSIKYEWMQRCYDLGKPFALLMPVEMIGTKKAQAMFTRYGFEFTFLDRRINFKMPNKGYDGNGAQFPTMWYSWQLTGQPVRFCHIERSPLAEWYRKGDYDEVLLSTVCDSACNCQHTGYPASLSLRDCAGCAGTG